MFLPLDGPSAQDTVPVGTGAVVEVKVGASSFLERKVVTVQPKDGRIYLYFGGDGAAPSVATVLADGLLIFKNGKESYEASSSQKLYMLAVSGTVNVTVVERS